MMPFVVAFACVILKAYIKDPSFACMHAKEQLLWNLRCSVCTSPRRVCNVHTVQYIT